MGLEGLLNLKKRVNMLLKKNGPNMQMQKVPT